MQKQVIGSCPICGEQIEITEITCSSCDTVIKGHFRLCRFCRLSKEQMDFAEIFIKNRGNIKEIERELGISYPTVKGKLDALIEALGYKTQTNPAADRKDILEKLDRGEITAEEAIDLLNE